MLTRNNKVRSSIVLPLFVLAASYCVILLTGCAAPRFPMVRPSEEALPSMYSSEKAKEYFVRGLDYERRGLYKIATREFENALQFDPESRVLKERLIKLYVNSERFQQALLLLKNGRKGEELTRDEKRLLSTIYLKMNEIEKAAWTLESIKDKSAEESYSLGVIYESLGNLKKSIPYYSRYFTEKKDDLQTGFKIVRLLLLAKSLKAADTLLGEMQAEAGARPDIFVLRSTVALLEGDTAQGLLLLDSALQQDSLHEETLRVRAQIYIDKAEYVPAISNYEKLAKNYPYDGVYHRTLALLLYYNSQFSESEKLLLELLPGAMDDPQLHTYLGLVYNAQGKSDLAVIEFEKALALKKEDEDVWRELCGVYLKRKELDDALGVTVRYTTQLSESTAAWRLRGYVEAVRKEYAAAVKSYRHAVKIDSLDLYSWFELGSMFERRGSLDSSEFAFRKVLASKPDDPATLNYLGYMWADKGIKLDSAKAFLVRALDKEPDNGAFLDSYAWVLFRQGNLDSAHLYIKKALDRIDDDPVVYQHFGEILLKMDNLREALVYFRKSLEFTSDEEAEIRKKVIDLESLLDK